MKPQYLKNTQEELKQTSPNCPDAYICAICQDVMDDPVETPDRQCYDRYCIEEWFRYGKKTSPLTGKTLPDLALKEVNFAFKSALTEYLTKEVCARKAQYKQELLQNRSRVLASYFEKAVIKLNDLAQKQATDETSESLIEQDYNKARLILQNINRVETLCTTIPTTITELWSLTEKKVEYIFSNADKYIALTQILKLPFTTLANSYKNIDWLYNHRNTLEQLSVNGVNWDQFMQLEKSDKQKYDLCMKYFNTLVLFISGHNFKWGYLQQVDADKLYILLNASYSVRSIMSLTRISWLEILQYPTHLIATTFKKPGQIDLLINDNIITYQELIAHPKLTLIMDLDVSYTTIKHLINISDFINLHEHQQNWILNNRLELDRLLTNCKFITLEQLAKASPDIRNLVLKRFNLIKKLSEHLNIADLIQLSSDDAEYVLDNLSRFLGWNVAKLETKHAVEPDKIAELLQSIHDFKTADEQARAFNVSLHSYDHENMSHYKYVKHDSDTGESSLLTIPDKQTQTSRLLTINQKWVLGAGVGMTSIGGALWIAFVATGIISYSGATTALATLLAIACPVVTVAGVCMLAGLGIYKYLEHRADQQDNCSGYDYSSFR